MQKHAIETCGLTRRFGSQLAVDDMNLLAPEAGVYGFLGPNGAGKTTTIRMLLGLIRPDAGEVSLFGAPLSADRLSLMRIVGALVETSSLYPHLTGRENLEVTRRLLGAPRGLIDDALGVVKLEQDADRRVREYSMGMRQRLGLALALLNKPRLLVLDEPTNGLDPAGIHEMRDLIRRLPAEFGARSSSPATCSAKSNRSPATSASFTRAGFYFRARWPNCRPGGGDIWSSALSRSNRRCAVWPPPAGARKGAMTGCWPRQAR